MKATTRIVIALTLWGSIGVFVRNIDFPPIVISFYRAIIASVVLLIFLYVRKEKVNFQLSRKEWVGLMISAIFIGFNWVFLFEAYRLTTIANATISYYMAPVIVIAVSPFVFKERVTMKKIAIVLAALTGLFMIMSTSGSQVVENNLYGVLLGLLAASLYASIVIINKMLQIDRFVRVFIQLFFSAVVLIPFILNYDIFHFSNQETIINLLILGVIHTALAYYLFYTSIEYLKAQRVAILSFIDPLTAVILGAIVFSEGINVIQVIGGLLILSGTVLSKED